MIDVFSVRRDNLLSHEATYSNARLHRRPFGYTWLWGSPSIFIDSSIGLYWVHTQPSLRQIIYVQVEYITKASLFDEQELTIHFIKVWHLPKSISSKLYVIIPCCSYWTTNRLYIGRYASISNVGRFCPGFLRLKIEIDKIRFADRRIKAPSTGR